MTQPNLKPSIESYVLLKDGTMLVCTASQKEALGLAILMTKDLDKKNIKLGGRIFKLSEIEDDIEKIYAHKQQGLPLNVEEPKQKQNGY